MSTTLFVLKDDDVEYATCSVSDLVAIFEAKAAQIAAMETSSICSEPVARTPLECEDSMSPEKARDNLTRMGMSKKMEMESLCSPPLKLPLFLNHKLVGQIFIILMRYKPISLNRLAKYWLANGAFLVFVESNLCRFAFQAQPTKLQSG